MTKRSEEVRSPQRFVVDERVGIVAVRDTQHPDYDPSGCLSSNPDIVASWEGVWSKSEGWWNVPPEVCKNAVNLCSMLNKLKARPSTEADKPQDVMSLGEELEYLIQVIVRDELENQANS